MATFSVHYDGPITVDHKVPLRVMARTYEHMQRAIDRAYLINQYGDVYKHARLTTKQYAATEFIAEYPQPGGIILDAFRRDGGPIIDRVFAAIRPVFERAAQQGLQQHATLAQQREAHLNYVAGMGQRVRTFADMANDPPPAWAEAYSNRSVIKEIDQLVVQVTPRDLEGSTIEITLRGTRAHLPFKFDASLANRFHHIAADRELGAPVIAEVQIRNLDKGNRFTKPKAKVLNLDTTREVTLHLSGERDFLALHPHHTRDVVKIFVCPVVEAGGFDLKSGDLLFLALAE